MKKVFLLMAVLPLVLCAQQRLLDQPMQIKNISMKVEADDFTAVTFIEMEFYNPHAEEIEGLYRFSLQPGQVVTAFQLDLFGKFRDGSIEEKWKARNAYNTIVGKRIDPALLTYEYDNHYRLNIYPVPAKSSRKITMTIHQQLLQENGKRGYRFQWNRSDTTERFQLQIQTKGCSVPKTGEGLLGNHIFQKNGIGFQLLKNTAPQPLSQPLEFWLEDPGFPLVNYMQQDGLNWYALKIRHDDVPDHSPLQVKNILVYWDVSASASERNINREISFLRSFIQQNRVQRMEIVPFATELQQPATFLPGNNNSWISYLRSLQLNGATRFDQLDFTRKNHDAILVFTDGHVSLGKKSQPEKNLPVYSINTSDEYHDVNLRLLSGSTGGSAIHINQQKMHSAVSKASRLKNHLLSVSSASGATSITIKQKEDHYLLFGNFREHDTLVFRYGNSSGTEILKKFVLRSGQECQAAGINRLGMLTSYPGTVGAYNWEDMLEFGITEKVVTPQTAYIVLERAEDYIRFNITPPKELEEECLSRGFVTKEFKSRKQQWREKDTYMLMNDVVQQYNQVLKKWDRYATGIYLSPVHFEKQYGASAANTAGSQLQGSVPGLSVTGAGYMNEVVVTVPYGTQRRSSFTGSEATITARSINRFQVTSITRVLEGQIPGIMVTNGGGAPGSDADVLIRGLGSVSASNSPLYLLDGIPYTGLLSSININDIDRITVLKDASSTALYGSRAANGVIMITTKKFNSGQNRYYHNYYKPYRLKDMEDVDYLQEIRSASGKNKWDVYLYLLKGHKNEPLFYIDMATHFFETGSQYHAYNILMNALEAGKGEPATLRAVAFTMENWGWYEKAAGIYRSLITQHPADIFNHHDLGWAVYQSGRVREAVQILYQALTMNFENREAANSNTKTIMLSDLNAMIAMHRDSLDFSFVPAELKREMPVDIRISVSSNNGRYPYASVEEHGKQTTGKWLHYTSGYIHADYNASTFEYHNRFAEKGRYRVWINYYDHPNNKEPVMIRVRCFKNFAGKNQQISTENFILNNQWGEIQVTEISY